MSALTIQADAEYRWQKDTSIYKMLLDSFEQDCTLFMESKDTPNVDVPSGKVIDVYNRDLVATNSTLTRDFQFNVQYPQFVDVHEPDLLMQVHPTVHYTDAPTKFKGVKGMNALFDITIVVHTSTNLVNGEFVLDLNVGDLLGAATIMGATRRIVTNYSALLIATVMGTIKKYSDVPIVTAKFAMRHNIKPEDEYDSLGISIKTELKICGVAFEWQPKEQAEVGCCKQCDGLIQLPPIVYEHEQSSNYFAGRTINDDNRLFIASLITDAMDN